MTQGIVQVKIVELTDELRSLAQWLRSEDELRGRVRLANRPVQVGDMGAALDAVVIAVSGGGAATIFVQSLFAWLSQRQKNMSVRLRLVRPDGQDAELDLTGIRDPEAVIDKVLKFFMSGEQPP
jgi:hypothetical protein